ncbi:MAG: hypothetical protein EOP51_28610 [Sphingobacteriales bacterium]|nr:MAG: hypothetical protein EOP51_28610 [Sphingobacteriales bacterium]
MTESVIYHLETEDGVRSIKIKPINEVLPNGDHYATGIFDLSEGDVGLGQVIFDILTDEWEYNGVGELTQDQLFEIVSYIHKHKRDGE